MKPLLDFDDAGAQDDEPVKGVTVGDIRAWHDQYDRLLSSWAECRDFLSKERVTTTTLTEALQAVKEQSECGMSVMMAAEILARLSTRPLMPNPAMKKTLDL